MNSQFLHTKSVRTCRLMSCLLVSALLVALAGGSAGANVQVNQDPPGLIQNSPSITIDPVSGNLISAYTDNPWGNPAWGIGTSYSTDWGVTWTDSPTQIRSVWIGF